VEQGHPREGLLHGDLEAVCGHEHHTKEEGLGGRGRRRLLLLLLLLLVVGGGKGGAVLPIPLTGVTPGVKIRG